MHDTLATPTPRAVAAARNHRRRLLEGLAICVARQGYADTTIADIAMAAHVSKRTFYERFESKQQCMIALYETASDLSRRQLQLGGESELDWPTRLEVGIRNYLVHLSAHPLLLRALFMEIQSLGADGLRARRGNFNALARTLQLSAATQGVELTPPQAASLVGMLSEWILLAIEDDRVAALPDDAPSIALMLRAAIEGRRAIDPPAR
jgi:AcrR family transcriptional regulator